MTTETTTPDPAASQDALRDRAQEVQHRALEAKMAAATPLIDALMRRTDLAVQVAAAQAELADVDGHLAALHRDAKKAGWTDAELAAASLDVPTDPTRASAGRRGGRGTTRRRTPRTTASTSPAVAGDADTSGTGHE